MSAVPIVVAAILAGQSGLAEPTDTQWQKCAEGLTEIRLASCKAIAGNSEFTSQSRAFAAATLGDILLEQHDPEKAIGAFTRAINFHQDYSYPYRRRAFAHYLQGRHDDAQSDYSAAIEISPLDPYAFISRSSYYRQTRRWDLARSDIDKALDLDLDNPDSYYERGLLSLDIKDFEQAGLDFGKILELDPADNNARYNFANALRSQSRNDEALASISRYIGALPDDPQGYRLRGWINMDLGHFDAARADFTAALQRDAQSRSLRYALGFAHWRSGDYARALEHYHHAEPDYESFGYFYYERGYAHYMLNQDHDALADANRALAIDSGDYDAMWLKGAALLFLNDYPPALDILNKAARLAPDNAEILIMRGRVNIAAGQPLAAVGDFSMALNLKPDSPAAEIYRAYASGLAGGMGLATETLERILDETPDSALATELMARLLFNSKDYTSARHYSDRLVRLVPGAPEHQVLHADILLELGAYSEAANVYGLAVSATDEPPANWLQMAAYASHKADDTDSALHYLERASRADRTDIWTHGLLGDLLYQRGKFDRARSAYQQALEISDDEQERDDYRIDIARTLTAIGSHEQALDMIDPLAGRNPDDAELAWMRANILFDLRRLEDALAAFESYRKLKPTSLEVHYRLVEILSALDRHGRAIESADTIVYMEDDKASGYLTRGKLRMALGDFRSAALDFQRAADADPGNVTIRQLQARAFIGLGEAEKALVVLSAISKPEDQNVELLILTAEAQEMLGEHDAAERALAQARALEGGDISPQRVELRKALR